MVDIDYTKCGGLDPVIQNIEIAYSELSAEEYEYFLDKLLEYELEIPMESNSN